MLFQFRIYLDMLNVYKVMSENITAAITHNGEQVRLLFGTTCLDELLF